MLCRIVYFIQPLLSATVPFVKKKDVSGFGQQAVSLPQLADTEFEMRKRSKVS
jgi:hypothetical protein